MSNIPQGIQLINYLSRINFICLFYIIYYNAKRRLPLPQKIEWIPKVHPLSCEKEYGLATALTSLMAP